MSSHSEPYPGTPTTELLPSEFLNPDHAGSGKDVTSPRLAGAAPAVVHEYTKEPLSCDWKSPQFGFYGF